MKGLYYDELNWNLKHLLLDSKVGVDKLNKIIKGNWSGVSGKNRNKEKRWKKGEIGLGGEKGKRRSGGGMEVCGEKG